MVLQWLTQDPMYRAQAMVQANSLARSYVEEDAMLAMQLLLLGCEVEGEQRGPFLPADSLDVINNSPQVFRPPMFTCAALSVLML
jgi:hypothetical protein